MPTHSARLQAIVKQLSLVHNAETYRQMLLRTRLPGETEDAATTRWRQAAVSGAVWSFAAVRERMGDQPGTGRCLQNTDAGCRFPTLATERRRGNTNSALAHVIWMVPLLNQLPRRMTAAPAAGRWHHSGAGGAHAAALSAVHAARS